MTGKWKTALLFWGICWAACAPTEESAQSERAAAIFDRTVAVSTLGPIGGGNALTLPAQRHLVRVGGTDLIAIQQDGANGRFLGLYRSEDSGLSWRYVGGIVNQRPPRATADLLVAGQDVAVLHSYEGPSLFGSSLHDVVFQWWRRSSSADTWVPDAPVRVFDSTSDSTAYSRAEMTRDSLGRIWVVAFRLNADGSNSAQVAVSTDGGASFRQQPDLATMPFRGGGRLVSLGTRLLFLWDGHKTADPTRMRLRSDGDPVDEWSAAQAVFSEGIYHGAALSAVVDGRGGLHLFYKDKTAVLWYRHFDGATSTWGARQLIEDVGDWALQPAASRIGDDLVVFYNRVIDTNTNDEMRLRVLSNGVWSPPRVIDSTVSWKGYPRVPEVLPATATAIPCVAGVTPDANGGGVARVYTLSWTASPPVADLGAPRADLAAPVDLAPPPPPDLAPPPPPPPLDAGTGTGTLTFRETYRNAAMDLLAVAPDGTAYARSLSTGSDRIFISTDGARTWTERGRHPLRYGFKIMSALADNTLLATVRAGTNFVISRSTDRGATWTDVLSLGPYRTLQPRSIQELGGTVFLLEYQSFTDGDTPIRLWASTDRGASFTVRTTFQGHRHGHGLRADPSTNTLWAYFGDSTRQSGVYRSTDGGRTFTQVLGGQPSDIVDATVLPGGDLLFGQDISFLPDRPTIARLSPSGTLTTIAPLPGPSYSIQRLSGGGFVVGVEREANGDLYPPGDYNAHLFGSPDGERWSEVARFTAADPANDVRADVYYELPSTRKLVIQLSNAAGFGPDGRGYVLLAPQR